MKNRISRTFLGPVALAFLLLVAFLVSSLEPGLARRWERAQSPHVWYLELVPPPARVEEQALTTTALTERMLRSRSYVKDLHLNTLGERVFAFFRTPANQDVRAVGTDLGDALRGLSSSSKWTWKLFWQPSEETTLGKNFSALVLSLQERLLGQGARPSILSLANADMSLEWNDVAHSPAIHEVDTLLQRLVSLRGVQSAFARNIEFPAIHIEFDPRDLLRMGISSSTVRRTLERHYQAEPVRGVPLLGNETSIYQEKAASDEEICSISFPGPNGVSLLRICDVARLAHARFRLPYYMAGTSRHETAQELASRTDETREHHVSIQILLHSDADEAQTRAEMAKALDESGAGAHWNISTANPPPSEEIWLIPGIGLVLSAMVAAGLKRTWSTALLVASLSGGSWTAILLALGVLPDPLGILVLSMSTIVSLSARFLWSSIPGAKAMSLSRLSALVAAATFGAGLHVVTRVTGGDPLALRESFTTTTAFLLPLALAASFPQSPISLRSADLAHRKVGRFTAIFAVATGVMALLTQPGPGRNELWIQLGFDTPSGSKAASPLLGELQRIAKDKGVAPFRFAGPATESQIEIGPTRFALLGKVPIEADEILESLEPAIAGYLNDMNKTPILVEGSVPESRGSTLEGFLSWLQTVQQPIPSDGKTALQSRFVSLAALVEPQWREELASIPSSAEGFGILGTFPEAPDELVRAVKQTLETFRNQKAPAMRIRLENASETQKTLERKAHQARLGMALLATVMGALMFASTRRALLSGMTYLALDALAEIWMRAVPGGSAAGTAHAAFPSPGTWTAIVLLVFWFIMLKTSDSRRAANMSLEDAFRPTFLVARCLRLLGLPLLAANLVTRFLFLDAHAVTAAAWAFWAVAAWFIADWMLLSTQISEYTDRWALRTRIRIVSLFASAACLLVAFPLREARAQGSSDTVDAGCRGTATLILPVLGRPKGKEPPPQKGIFAERLAQETPCSWYSTLLAPEIAALVQENRNAAGQGILVEKLLALVRQHRKSLEEELRRGIPAAWSGDTPPQTRIYGGFYEEFYGNIAFTVIDFREEGEPIVAKMTFPEESQTQGVATIAEYLRGESTKFYEEFLGESERLPVNIDSVESLDKHPVSENLAGEMDLFLRSRFLYPISFNWFERKTFFRAERDRDRAKYSLNVKIRRDGTKFYSSVTTMARGGGQRRTAWIEGDVSRMPAFEEEVLAASKRTLTSLEGITDYCAAITLGFFTDFINMTRLYGIAFRQNLGNAASTIRLRNGDHTSRTGNRKYSLLSLGGAVGWQFADLRWFAADLGFSLDGGLASSAASGASSRSVFINLGTYAQAQILLRNNFAGLARFGIEQPQLFGSQTLRDTVFSAFHANTEVGFGITF